MARTPLRLDTVAPDYPRRFGDRERKLIEALQTDKNIEELFEAPECYDPFSRKAVGSPVAFSSKTEPLAEDEFTFRVGKTTFQGHVIAAESTGTTEFNLPYVSADGLEMAASGENDHITSVELTNGIVGGLGCAYTVGSLPDGKAVIFEAKIKIDGVSEVTELWCGFRKAEAFNTDPDGYDEMACFNIGEDADGQIEIHTILNGAATTRTDTTETDWADAAEKALRVEVANDGVCTFTIDGAAPAVTQAFTFDSGEVIVPFVALTPETGDPGVSISEWRCGVK
jgi:hypothetical protein